MLRLVLSCSECDNSIDGWPYDAYPALKMARRAAELGWKSVKRCDGFADLCPDCAPARPLDGLHHSNATEAQHAQA
jgi:hypothetical protein